jgi:uncharacterized protein (DUF305 family)
MTRRVFPALVLALLAVIAATALAGAQTAGTTEGPAGVSTATAPFDQQFIDAMAAHHQGAIAMSRMALEQARSSKVKRLARSIIRGQSAELRTFQQLRKRWYGDAAFHRYDMSDRDMWMMGMPPHMEHMLNGAKNFDRMFLTMMIPHHAGAVAMANWEMSDGEHAALKRIATHEYVSQSQEIGQMQRMLGRPAM